MIQGGNKMPLNHMAISTAKEEFTKQNVLDLTSKQPTASN
jgi:hypothetical protein